jgi:hypothetical protein
MPRVRAPSQPATRRALNLRVSIAAPTIGVKPIRCAAQDGPVRTAERRLNACPAFIPFSVLENIRWQMS